MEEMEKIEALILEEKLDEAKERVVTLLESVNSNLREVLAEGLFK